MNQPLTAADLSVAETVQRDGIAVLPDLVDADELAPLRAEFDQAYLDAGKGPGTPGVRDSLSGDVMLGCPHMARLFSHPRLLAVIAHILGEVSPWVWQLKTNRYTPEHKGVSRHTDGVLGELAPPFTRQSMAVFLDDIDESSGALTYVPGTHLLHFADPAQPGRTPPTQQDIDAGTYVPASLRAGSVVLRVPEVWHAVIPIHRMRRYVTGSYMIRGTLSPAMTERVLPERERRAAAGTDHVPEHLRHYYVF